MFVSYMHCGPSMEGDPVGFVTAPDRLKYLSELDYEALTQCNECLWIVPGTLEAAMRRRKRKL